jgi:formylglycine-generating enzyme required for sulfatase activity
MVHVPAGDGWLGTGDAEVRHLERALPGAGTWREKGRFRREQPRHRVFLGAYALGRTPVTVGQFRFFVQDGGYRRATLWTEAGRRWVEATGRQHPDHWHEPRWTGEDNLPVVGVTWYEAVAFARWLSAVSGRTYRLPSEAEWEQAARGGRNWTYPWGEELDITRCNIRDSGLGRTVPVGAYSPAGDSAYGCAEMVGNVSEWTSTRYAAYPYEAHDGRERLAGDRERVTRGGSWHSPALRARNGARGMNDPFFSDSDLGFRLAGSSPQGTSL